MSPVGVGEPARSRNRGSNLFQSSVNRVEEGGFIV